MRTRTGRLVAAVEIVAWWAGLWALWLLLIGPVDGWELSVGAGAALLSAYAARLARRAVAER